nr:hypothetical protein [Tanacetum cinerariifolium]
TVVGENGSWSGVCWDMRDGCWTGERSWADNGEAGVGWAADLEQYGEDQRYRLKSLSNSWCGMGRIWNSMVKIKGQGNDTLYEKRHIPKEWRVLHVVQVWEMDKGEDILIEHAARKVAKLVLQSSFKSSPVADDESDQGDGSGSEEGDGSGSEEEGGEEEDEKKVDEEEDEEEGF